MCAGPRDKRVDADKGRVNFTAKNIFYILVRKSGASHAINSILIFRQSHHNWN